MAQSSESRQEPDPTSLTLTFGHEQLTIRRRYQALSVLNDFLIAAWFLVGSVLFLFPAVETLAVWCFIIGSAQFMARPTIRLAHYFHLQRLPGTEWDF